MSQRTRLFLVFLFSFAFLLVLQSTTIFPDPDSFYHAGMTQIIRDGDWIPKTFSWLSFTILGSNYVDHHYLYHIALIPFSFIHPLLGLKVATAFFGGLFLVVFARVLFSLRVKYPELFLILLITHGPLLFRLSLVKAPSFSLLILLLMILAMVRKQWVMLGLVSFVYVWAYDGWVIGFIVAGVVWVVRAFGVMVYQGHTVSFRGYIREVCSKESLALMGSVCAGIVLGIIVNPYFPGNVSFFYDHIVKIGFIGYRQVIGVGGEWYGYPLPELMGASAIAMAFFVLAMTMFFLRLKEQDEWSLVALMLTLLFAIATVRSQRHVEYFIPFLVMFIALASRPLEFASVREAVLKRMHSKRWVAVGYIVLFVVSFAVTKDFLLVRRQLNNGFQFTFLKEESEWIQEHIPNGETVFHSNWDEFPALFFYNRANRYVAGLDPAFLYANDKKRFFLWRDITQGTLSKNLSSILRTEFGSHVVLASSKHDKLRANLESQGFVKRFEGPNAAVYTAAE